MDRKNKQNEIYLEDKSTTDKLYWLLIIQVGFISILGIYQFFVIKGVLESKNYM
jgi:hypothetical protein